MSYFIPDIDNFWHGQSTIMFLDNRLPLYIVCLCKITSVLLFSSSANRSVFLLQSVGKKIETPQWLPTWSCSGRSLSNSPNTFTDPFFIYSASVATHHLNLKAWVRPFAVGLGVVLIDLPFDIVGIKQLWWTWHDTDPNIYDRMYWVPWNSYYFHAAFASSLTFLLQMFRYLMTGSCEMHHYSRYVMIVLISVYLSESDKLYLIAILFQLLQGVVVQYVNGIVLNGCWNSAVHADISSSSRSVWHPDASLRSHAAFFVFYHCLESGSKYEGSIKRHSR